MKKQTLLAVGLALLTIAATPSTQPDGSSALKPGVFSATAADELWKLRTEREILDAALVLTEEQAAQVEELFAAEERAVLVWDAENQPRLDELRDQINALWDERNRMNHTRQKIRFAHQDQRRTVMNETQNLAMETFMLLRMIMRRSVTLELTDEQLAEIRGVCESYAPRRLALRGEANDKARENLEAEMRTHVMETILTEAQWQSIRSRGRPNADGPATAPAGD